MQVPFVGYAACHVTCWNSMKAFGVVVGAVVFCR